MFAFTPKSEEEINALKSNLLAEGSYPFLVKDVTQKVSAAGNPMLELKLAVYDQNKAEHLITDYLVSTDKMAYKLRHFCEAIGLINEYAKGCFNPTQCIMRRGYLQVIIQKGKPKPDGSGYYPDRNAIKDYNKPDHLDQKKPVAANHLIDDDIPF